MPGTELDLPGLQGRREGRLDGRLGRRQVREESATRRCARSPSSSPRRLASSARSRPARGASARPSPSLAARLRAAHFFALRRQVDDHVRDRDSAKRSRACVTTPRSSQCERPSGCVEMMSSSAPKVRSASSIACNGSPSPISPRASMPCSRIAERGSPRDAPGGRAGVVLVGDPVLERRVQRGRTTRISVRRPCAFSRIVRAELVAADGLVGDTSSRSSSGADSDAGTVFSGGPSRLPPEEPPGADDRLHDEDAETPPATADQAGEHDQPEVDDRQATGSGTHRPRSSTGSAGRARLRSVTERRPSCRRRSTSRRRSASRSREPRCRDGPRR